ncbi:MAG: hypothetical protein GX807_02930 [Erysipelotrichia bacterium]|nr:hypothetical protein [Erysipelotrichia bacterium]
MDIQNEIEKIESSINIYRLNVAGKEAFEIVMRLAYFEYPQYKKLIVELNKLRKRCSTYDEKAAFVCMYQAIYHSAKKMYKKTLKSINLGKLEIKHHLRTLNDGSAQKAIEHFLNDAGDVDFDKSCLKIMTNGILKQLADIKDELYVLDNHPDDYINTFSTYIGPDSIMRYRNDRVYYKDVSIIPTDSHSYSVSYNEKTTTSTKNAILDIFAYLNGMPYLYFTDNPEFNRKICDLYEKFDLLDMVRLRKKNYFAALSDEPISLQLPILRSNNDRFLIEIPDSQHEKVFELYQASLKQFEPMPRCVFLYRVFEYGAKYHYQHIMHPANYDPKDAIEYYLSNIFTHKYAPLYYIVYGRVSIEGENSDTVKVLKKSTCVNYISRLKKEARSILLEWSKHNYLKNKRLGEIIYNTGRNASAHASGGHADARYDYGLNYQHINNVNIILELIARYIVEELNPDIVKLVESNHDKYIKQSFLGV